MKGRYDVIEKARKRNTRLPGRPTGILVMLGVLAALLALAVLAAGCGGDETTTTAGNTSSTQAGSSTTAAPAGVTKGGTLKIGMQPGNGQYDPIMMAGSVGDILLTVQALENLVDISQEFTVVPVLATEWNTTDAKVWKVTLRDGVKFTNGQPFTADDVVYSFGRLQAKESPMAEVLANLDTVVADDPTHVTFTLKAPDAEFMMVITDYRAKMFCKSVADPMKELVGTGPYMLESFAAEDRAVLKANPDYWGTDESGEKLPYLDGLEFIYSPDTAGQIEGLRGGSLNWVGGITADQKATVESDPNLKAITTKTNYCNELQIRVDSEPGSKKEFRQALWAGTDRQALVDLVAPGVADPGNGTLVGPVFANYYLDESPRTTPRRPRNCLRRPVTPTAPRSAWSPRPPIPSLPSPPPGRRR